jgi:hypothetical protein
MRSQTTTAWYALAALACLAHAPALADETGLAGIHSWKKVAGRTCMIDHEHDGSGNGHTPEVAMRSAIKSWESFTDLEYGSDWASYANSVAKRARCGRSVMGDISCQISSRPCRGGALAPKSVTTGKRRAERR